MFCESQVPSDVKQAAGALESRCWNSNAYLLLDDFEPTIRRVAYDLDKELKALSNCGIPHADWTTRILRSATPQKP
jgi:hypothetical protein